jgi:glycosyltransferase involved in cell wall biosynthesis
VRSGFFYPRGERSEDEFQSLPRSLADLIDHDLVIINPRGFRAYVRNDTYFRAIPLVLEEKPETCFLNPAMEGIGAAEDWVRKLGIESNVRLLPRLPPAEMGAIFRLASIAISPTEHDGTPNTLLEAMACGCFPVAGDLISIREWIEHGKNGLLFDPADPKELANAVLQGIADLSLRAQAAKVNKGLIQSRAAFDNVMAEAEDFYRLILGS